MFLAIDKSSIRILIINILYKTENCSFFKAVYKQTFFAQNKLYKFCGFFLFHSKAEAWNSGNSGEKIWSKKGGTLVMWII